MAGYFTAMQEDGQKTYIAKYTEGKYVELDQRELTNMHANELHRRNLWVRNPVYRLTPAALKRLGLTPLVNYWHLIVEAAEAGPQYRLINVYSAIDKDTSTPIAFVAHDAVLAETGQKPVKISIKEGGKFPGPAHSDKKYFVMYKHHCTHDQTQKRLVTVREVDGDAPKPKRYAMYYGWMDGNKVEIDFRQKEVIQEYEKRMMEMHQKGS